MPATPSSNVPAAARLASTTTPLGGTGRPAAKAASTTSRAATPAAFSDVLSQEMGGGLDASDPMAALMGLSGLSGAGAAGASGAGGLSLASAMASPQMAKALSQASKSAGTAGATGTRPAAGAATPSTSKAQRAVAWAKSMVGKQDWNNLCERFVEEAYGTRGVFPTAKAAGQQIVSNRGWSGLQKAPVGALLYFAADETNDNAGHAAIYLGDGKMVSARPDGVKIEAVDTPYNKARYLGWGQPPAKFQGLGAKPSGSKAAVPSATSALGALGIARAGTSVPGSVPGTAVSVPQARSLTGAVTPPRLPAATGRR